MSRLPSNQSAGSTSDTYSIAHEPGGSMAISPSSPRSESHLSDPKQTSVATLTSEVETLRRAHAWERLSAQMWKRKLLEIRESTPIIQSLDPCYVGPKKHTNVFQDLLQLVDTPQPPPMPATMPSLVKEATGPNSTQSKPPAPTDTSSIREKEQILLFQQLTADLCTSRARCFALLTEVKDLRRKLREPGDELKKSQGTASLIANAATASRAQPVPLLPPVPSIPPVPLGRTKTWIEPPPHLQTPIGYQRNGPLPPQNEIKPQTPIPGISLPKLRKEVTALQKIQFHQAAKLQAIEAKISDLQINLQPIDDQWR